VLKKSCTWLSGIFILIYSGLVHAEDFRLQFNDAVYGGFQTVDLHWALYEQHQVDASSLELDYIEVILKSKYGGGLAWTGSPYSQRDRRVVYGQAANFYNPSGWSFSRIVFPATGLFDDLLLNMNGQFSLREVLVRTRD
jgi:hypothetical protein